MREFELLKPSPAPAAKFQFHCFDKTSTIDCGYFIHSIISNIGISLSLDWGLPRVSPSVGPSPDDFAQSQLNHAGPAHGHVHEHDKDEKSQSHFLHFRLAQDADKNSLAELLILMIFLEAYISSHQHCNSCDILRKIISFLFLSRHTTLTRIHDTM